MSEKKKDESVPTASAIPGIEVVKEATPNWEKLLYTPERKAAFQKGEMNLRDYHAISGPEMLQMALIGFRLYEQGKYSEAKTIFSGLISLEPTESYYHTALGAVFLAEEDLEMARGYFDVAIALNPKEVAPYVNRGEVNLRDGKILEAAEDFAKAVELDPKFEDPLTQRARVLAAAALEMIESATKDDKKEEPKKDAKKK
ncbi:MAG: type III secretion protein [Archangium sp.]|nr:type III secretion protein [Archangium sp.]